MHRTLYVVFLLVLLLSTASLFYGKVRHVHNMHVHDMHVHNMHVHDMHVHNMHVHDMHVHNMHVHDMHVHNMHVHDMHVHDMYRYLYLLLQLVQCKRRFMRTLFASKRTPSSI